eukprot:Selendium_serpulae@DN6139_c3_g1_i10.p1
MKCDSPAGLFGHQSCSSSAQKNNLLHSALLSLSSPALIAVHVLHTLHFLSTYVLLLLFPPTCLHQLNSPLLLRLPSLSSPSPALIAVLVLHTPHTHILIP